MLPIARGQGELWNGNRFLCAVDYDISAPLTFVTVAGMQRIQLRVHDYECEQLLNIAGLTLVLADGTRHRLPRPLNLHRAGHLECFLVVET
jgi:hypothetical protein